MRFVLLLLFLPFLANGQAQLVVDSNIGEREIFNDLLTLSSGSVVYSCKDPQKGVEPYISNGTAAGTKLINDIRANGDSYPKHFVEANGFVYYFAFATNTPSLFRSNITTGATVQVANLQLPPGSSYNQSRIFKLGNKVVFTTSWADLNVVIANYEIWSVDITSGDIQRQILSTGDTTLNVTVFARQSGDKLYFSIAKNQLWVTDGTLANTKKIGSIRPDLTIRNVIADGSKERLKNNFPSYDI
jgi:ELWxxDGT repeat protein